MEIDPKIVNFFLCVCHGANVSDDSAYYYIPFETKFNYLVMYSHPTLNESYETFENLFKNPCSLITGSCPFLPITKPNGKKEVYLPPLLFTTESKNDTPELIAAIGIYHLQIKKNDFQDCEIVAKDYIHNIDSLIGKFGTRFFTYSSMFRLVESYCKTRNLPLDEISLGILSCQSHIKKYLDKNKIKNDITTFVPKLLIDNRPNYRLKSSISSTEKFNLFAYPYAGDVENKEWNALGTIMTQGCAINVLSFYDILPENEARQRVSCLPITGTSIFKILDYLYNEFDKKFYMSGIDSFMIVRYDLRSGIKMLLTMIELFNENVVMFIKLYDNKMQNQTTTYSHTGHTISVYFELNKNIIVKMFLIDPQINLKVEIESNGRSNPKSDRFAEGLLATITNAYPSKKYIDLIFVKTKNLKTINEIHSDLHIQEENYDVITNETTGRGLGRGRKSRRLGLGRGRKSRRVTGKGKTQNIVDIIKKVDKQNGIKTAVSNSSIMENPHKIENPSQGSLDSLESLNGLEL